MSVIFVVLPVALVVVFAAVAAYVWAARRGQFDDLETPAIRVLHDDEASGPPPARRDEAPGDSEPAGGELPGSHERGTMTG